MEGNPKITEEKVQSLQGTLQRVNYQTREFTLVSQGRLWRFFLEADCQLWFNDAPAILRCFHPLDPVTVDYHGNFRVVALYSWEGWPVRRMSHARASALGNPSAMTRLAG